MYTAARGAQQAGARQHAAATRTPMNTVPRPTPTPAPMQTPESMTAASRFASHVNQDCEGADSEYRSTVVGRLSSCWSLKLEALASSRTWCGAVYCGQIVTPPAGPGAWLSIWTTDAGPLHAACHYWSRVACELE